MESQKDVGKKCRGMPPRAMRIIENGFFAYLSTTEPECQPHITTMFYLWDTDTCRTYMITSEDTRKLRNIKRNPLVAVTIDERDPESPGGNRGVLIRGKARILSVTEMGDVLMNRYLLKYLDFLGTGFPMGSRVVIEVIPRVFHYWRGVNFYKWINPNYDKTLHSLTRMVDL
jgi:uncharacterized protein YhbP (UPF0306 family)